jgi:hypothetical protein
LKRKQAEREAQQKKNDARAERANRRVRDSDEDKTIEHIGFAIVNDKCPICWKKVESKHKQHVLACMENPPEQKKPRVVRNIIAGEPKPRAKRTPKAKPAKEKTSAAKKEKKKPTKKASSPKKRASRKKKDDFSDSEESATSYSDSESSYGDSESE